MFHKENLEINDDSDSSDDSEVPEPFLNSKSAFRVSVCLERYYKDIRARCYLLIPRNRRVRWLKRRLQKIFALPDNFHLSTNGHMLPLSEPLGMLSPQDIINVIPFQEERFNFISNRQDLSINLNNCRERSSASEASYNNKALNEDVQHNSSQNSGIFHSQKGRSNNRSKNSKLTNIISLNKDDVDSASIASISINENNPRCSNNFDKANDTKQTLLNLKHQALALLESQIAVGSTDGEIVEGSLLQPPRRRRRVRKRKTQVQHTSQLEFQKLTDFLTGDTASNAISMEQTPEEITEASVSEVIPSPDAALEDQPSPSVNLSLPQEVTRNDAVCSRKPRVVHSLD